MSRIQRDIFVTILVTKDRLIDLELFNQVRVGGPRQVVLDDVGKALLLHRVCDIIEDVLVRYGIHHLHRANRTCITRNIQTNIIIYSLRQTNYDGNKDLFIFLINQNLTQAALEDRNGLSITCHQHFAYMCHWHEIQLINSHMYTSFTSVVEGTLCFFIFIMFIVRW